MMMVNQRMVVDNLPNRISTTHKNDWFNIRTFAY
jgi:hypothetical protein